MTVDYERLLHDFLCEYADDHDGLDVSEIPLLFAQIKGKIIIPLEQDLFNAKSVATRRKERLFEAENEITELKAELEKYRTYVHDGVWTLLDSPFAHTTKLLGELESQRLSFRDGDYDVTAEDLKPKQ